MEENISVKLNSTKQYIEGHYKGLITTEIGIELVQSVIDAIEEYKCRRILFDASEAFSSATTAENFEFALQMYTMLEKHGDFRWAVYYKNDPHMYEMVYNMIVQSGITNYFMTKDRAIALKWLLDI